ncbi:atrial natriuretic peptide receptor 2-like [Orbicella faveolata]|uniref:atrial natriuretic peptide receptor 2-like n=1 Tax=Orbicella faveolata TaxID=48498 RepID=UPI0009E1D21E|nr:atrial natriuretic peptide receptor 2-like [Orbicella faveolata]
MVSMAGSERGSMEELRGQIFTVLGIYEGNSVAVKKLQKAKVVLERDVLLELKEMKDLTHQNINTFIGACVEPGNICILSQYCAKGSLQDVLHNDSLKLDWMFQMSISSDIARGMHFLQNSPVQIHGNLKSSNVLIDSRWTCKVTDHGLFLFKEGQEVDVEAGTEAKYYDSLWTAPEHIFNEQFPRSQAGDVFSYGIILSEIVTRGLPYGMFEDLSARSMCDDPTWPYILAGSLVFVLIVSILVGFLLWQRKQAFEAALLAQTWKIKYEDIKWPKNKGKLGSRKSMVSMAGSERGSMEELRGQIFTVLGIYEGNSVAVKKLQKAKVVLERDVLLELKEMKDLTHQNINTFIGACVEPGNICILSQYCAKGSLQDVLHNDSLKLDWMFQMSISSDIARGMHFLQNSPVQIHGNLKSSNVLIDSRWTCKVTDHGLFLFKEGQEVDVEAGTEAKYYDSLWTAPEHIFNEQFPRSQAGDVFSYGIILSEIVTRGLPYGMFEDLSARSVIGRVQKGETPSFRPRITKDIVGHALYVDMMKQCWDQDPHARPKFTDCIKYLKQMNKGKDFNIMDTMITMMEKYTDHLEDIVAERTSELAAEKAKTDELLYRMLPRSVAEELKRGQPVTAETFDSASLFFSDLVGFTKLASESTPLQVVDLLNDLYTCFDEIIDMHDVYKVETIGDAYMVASGLPNRNGIRHAGEISNMSLDLLSAMTSFKIRHVPGKQLQLRIGIHTGPVVAGVVGLKMPRYCLFGDTVNYANRMESSGLALCIHVSPECREVLEQLGGYILEERGFVEMKGKGSILTYFLKGREGFDKPLPDLSLQAGMEEHSFK